MVLFTTRSHNIYIFFFTFLMCIHISGFAILGGLVPAATATRLQVTTGYWPMKNHHRIEEQI